MYVFHSIAAELIYWLTPMLLLTCMMSFGFPRVYAGLLRLRVQKAGGEYFFLLCMLSSFACFLATLGWQGVACNRAALAASPISKAGCVFVVLLLL